MLTLYLVCWTQFQLAEPCSWPRAEMSHAGRRVRGSLLYRTLNTSTGWNSKLVSIPFKILCFSHIITKKLPLQSFRCCFRWSSTWSCKHYKFLNFSHTHTQHTHHLNRQGEQNARKQWKMYLSWVCSISISSVLWSHLYIQRTNSRV